MPITRRELVQRARGVELLMFDVDGVLTDGGLFYGADGELFKRFDVKDGHGLVLARLAGLRAGILTARRSKIVEVRAAELKLAPVVQGARDKGEGLRALLAAEGLDPRRVGYVGDDINDLPPLKLVAFAACPADARPEVRRAAHYVAKANGGHGAAREIVEFVLKAQGKWDAVVAQMR